VHKKLLFVLFLILLGSISAVASFFFFRSDSLLVSPFLRFSPPPDLTPQLESKLSIMPDLDYSSSQNLDTISPAINYLVFNPHTQVVYLSKNQSQKISPASFTKLLTSIVALDVTKNDPLLTATATSIDKEPTVLGLKENEQLPLSDLIRGSIATSANDAAATIGEGVATLYNQPPSFFIDLMNQKAALLHLDNSHFTNPEGYDDDAQYSTLEDIAKLVYVATSDYPAITAAGASDMQNIEITDTHGFYYLPNWNGLLNIYPTVDGLKIAYTESSGYSTIVTANRQNIPVVVILQGSDSIRERDLAAAALLDAAYLAQHLAPINITRYQVDQKYKVWSDLAKKIRAELELLEQQDAQ